MKIAIVHENWGAGAARCARDLEAGLGIRHEVLYFPRNLEETYETVLQTLAEFRPNVVNCHSFYGTMPYEFLAEISRRYPTCFTVHDPRPIGDIEPACWGCDRNDWCLRCPLVHGLWRKLFRNKYLRRRLRKRRTHARCAPDLILVTPSAWMAAELRRQELGRFRILHIPNGIDLQRFQPTIPARAHFGLPEDGIILLHLAWHDAGEWAINKRKGLHLLAEAFKNQIAPRFPNVFLAVGGESVLPNHPRVIPLGMVSKNLPALLASVDLFVTATMADNFPYTVLEAMACGKPVVATAVGGLSEQVQHGETGFLVAPGDTTALGEMLSDLIATPSRFETLGAAGRRRAEVDFSLGGFLRAYESLFMEMAALRSSSTS